MEEQPFREQWYLLTWLVSRCSGQVVSVGIRFCYDLRRLTDLGGVHRGGESSMDISGTWPISSPAAISS
jgi:hypothetical protein